METIREQSTTSAQGTPPIDWRSLCLDWLEAHALRDASALDECLTETFIRLRAETRLPGISYTRARTTLVVSADATAAVEEPSEPAPVQSAPAEPATEPTAKKPTGRVKRGTPEYTAMMAERMRRYWAEHPEKFNLGKVKKPSPQTAPSPASATETAQSAPAPVSNGNSPVAVLDTLQQRQEACIEEIKAILADAGHVSPATEKKLAARFNLSLVGTEQLVLDTTRKRLEALARAAAKAEKAQEVTA